MKKKKLGKHKETSVFGFKGILLLSSKAYLLIYTA